MYRYGLMGRLPANPHWRCPDCRRWLADCPCSAGVRWRPTRGQLLEAVHNARLRPIQRMVVMLPLPLSTHLWDRAPIVEEFPLRDVTNWTGLSPVSLREMMTGLVAAGWLSAPIRVPKADRMVRVAVTIPDWLLQQRTRSPDTGRRRTRGMMRK